MFKRKDNGLWQEVLREFNGKPLKPPKYFYGKTQAEVKRKINEFKGLQERGVLFSEVADSWYASHSKNVRYKTAESYVSPLKQIIAEFGDWPIKEITPPQISGFIRSVEKQGYAKRTVQLRLDVLSMVFDFAISEYGCITVNPCAAVKLSKNLPSKKRELPPDEDIAQIIRHKNDDRFSLLPFLLCFTGLRLGEALALTDKDFGETIKVTKQVSWQPNQPVVEDWTKTERGTREVAILDVVREALPKWHGYLFSDDGITPYSKSAFTKRWRKYSQRTGVTCLRHQLRHEFATLLYDAEVDVKEAAAMMGHDEKVMRDIYTHIRDTRKQKTAQKLNAFVNDNVKM